MNIDPKFYLKTTTMGTDRSCGECGCIVENANAPFCPLCGAHFRTPQRGLEMYIARVNKKISFTIGKAWETSNNNVQKRHFGILAAGWTTVWNRTTYLYMLKQHKTERDLLDADNDKITEDILKGVEKLGLSPEEVFEKNKISVNCDSEEGIRIIESAIKFLKQKDERYRAYYIKQTDYASGLPGSYIMMANFLDSFQRLRSETPLQREKECKESMYSYPRASERQLATIQSRISNLQRTGKRIPETVVTLEKTSLLDESLLFRVFSVKNDIRQRHTVTEDFSIFAGHEVHFFMNQSRIDGKILLSALQGIEFTRVSLGAQIEFICFGTTNPENFIRRQQINQKYLLKAWGIGQATKNPLLQRGNPAFCLVAEEFPFVKDLLNAGFSIAADELCSEVFARQGRGITDRGAPLPENVERTGKTDIQIVSDVLGVDEEQVNTLREMHLTYKQLRHIADLMRKMGRNITTEERELIMDPSEDNVQKVLRVKKELNVEDLNHISAMVSVSNTATTEDVKLLIHSILCEKLSEIIIQLKTSL